MNSPWVLVVLAVHLALLSSLSFGGFPTVLPDVREFVVATRGWMTDQEFANFFALAQAIPGPNMILMMGFVGWKVAGIPGALVSAFATFGPPCAIYFVTYRLWDRSRAAPWQKIVRNGLVPVTVGLVIASGTVMARVPESGVAVRCCYGCCGRPDSPNANKPVLASCRGALGSLGLL